tara:strand:- start:1465 stop:2742 length:1278 start_codon:yes stop_codon:yes gene_type:complete
LKYVSYWHDTAQQLSDPPQKNASGRYDVVIIGAGFTGLGAARKLAKEGLRIAVFDSGEIGAGGSGRNGGHLNNGISHDFATAEKQLGTERASQIYKAYDQGIETLERIILEENINCDFRRSGKLKLASKETHFQSISSNYERLMNGPDPDVKLLSKKDLECEIGSDSFFGGMLQPKSASMHMGKFVIGLAEAAKRHGAEIYTNKKITGWTKKQSGWCIKTNSEIIESEAILLATGAYTPMRFNWWRRRMISVGSFITATRPLSDQEVNSIMPGRRNCVTSLNVGNYFRISPDNRLIFGGRARFTANANATSDIQTKDILQESLLDIFPQMSGVSLDYMWGGLVGISKDRFPRAGEHKGIHYVMGYSGHGAQIASHMGEIMADKIMGHSDRNPFKDIPWKPIPGYWGYPWFLPLTGMYFNWKDRLS